MATGLLINLIVAIVVIGLVLWLVETFIPMDPMIKTVLRVVVAIVLILWLLNAFGIISRAALPG